MTATISVEEFAELGLPAPDSLAQLDLRARRTFAKVPPQLLRDEELNSVLEQSANFLDQWRALAAIAEAVEHARARTFGEVFRQFGEILSRAKHFARIDVLAVFLDDPEIRNVARRPHRRPAGEDPFPVTPTPQFVRGVSSLLEFCPIDDLVYLGNWLGQPAIAHRCRLSYDWLRTFVRRHTPGEKTTLLIVGRAYAEGRLSLNEATHLLAMPQPDAVAWLEEYGFARDVEVISRLGSDAEARLRAIREDRLGRGGSPVSDPTRVAKNVIATQRIEGIDARPWIQSKA